MVAAETQHKHGGEVRTDGPWHSISGKILDLRVVVGVIGCENRSSCDSLICVSFFEVIATAFSPAEIENGSSSDCDYGFDCSAYLVDAQEVNVNDFDELADRSLVEGHRLLVQDNLT